MHFKKRKASCKGCLYIRLPGNWSEIIKEETSGMWGVGDRCPCHNDVTFSDVITLGCDTPAFAQNSMAEDDKPAYNP